MGVFPWGRRLSKHIVTYETYCMTTLTNNRPYRLITSPCSKTHAWGAVNRQYIPKGTNALQKGLAAILKGS